MSLAITRNYVLTKSFTYKIFYNEYLAIVVTIRKELFRDQFLAIK